MANHVGDCIRYAMRHRPPLRLPPLPPHGYRNPWELRNHWLWLRCRMWRKQDMSRVTPS